MECNHNVNDEKTTILINKDKWCGVHPQIYIGFCKVCGKYFQYNSKFEEIGDDNSGEDERGHEQN